MEFPTYFVILTWESSCKFYLCHIIALALRTRLQMRQDSWTQVGTLVITKMEEFPGKDLVGQRVGVISGRIFLVAIIIKITIILS